MRKLFSLIFLCVVVVELEAFCEEKEYYFSYPIRANGDEAYEACRERGMQLASIQTIEDQIKINSFVDLLSKNETFTSGYDGIYTSGRIIDDEFYWGNQSPLAYQTFSNWHIGEPDGNGEQECLAISKKYQCDKGFAWYDVHCSFDMYYLCVSY